MKNKHAMPIYEYICSANERQMEVLHHFDEKVETWGQLCLLAGIDPGTTSPDAPVKKQISTPSLAFPKTNTELKNLGFTKLVKRESGVYENVTATDKEKRYMRSDDPGSVPDLKSKITD